MKIFALSALALLLAGCYTTKLNMGPESSGEMEQTEFNAALIGGTGPVDVTKHCNGGNVANVTIKRNWFKEDVIFECGSGAMAKSGGDKKMKKKKKKGKKKKKKKKS